MFAFISRLQTRNVMQDYTSSLASRGIMFSNSARALSTSSSTAGFRPLRKPQWFSAFKQVSTFFRVTISFTVASCESFLNRFCRLAKTSRIVEISSEVCKNFCVTSNRRRSFARVWSLTYIMSTCLLAGHCSSPTEVQTLVIPMISRIHTRPLTSKCSLKSSNECKCHFFHHWFCASLNCAVCH